VNGWNEGRRGFNAIAVGVTHARPTTVRVSGGSSLALLVSVRGPSGTVYRRRTRNVILSPILLVGVSPTGTTGQGEVPDPTAAFKVLGNGTRLAILRELLDTMDDPPSFSELRKRLGMRDGSQFNYHLRKLEPAYVVRTDGSAGTDGSRGSADGRSADRYRLTIAGMMVTAAILAGTLIDQPTIPPFEVEVECVTCGGGLLARYEDEMVSVNCADCGQYHLFSFLPPGGLVDRTPEEVAAASDSYFRTCALSCMDGVCPGCAGRVRRSFLGSGNTLPAAVVGHSFAKRLRPTSGPGFVFECEQCPPSGTTS
jgi:DNA-binding transcriptional ArsR family regulator